MAILSIQSRVTSGYVGNAVAAPLLQRLGDTVWPIDTVVFSNHPAHGAFRGGVRPAEEVSALVAGLAERSLLSACDALLSGYLGSMENGRAVQQAADRIKRANNRALWFCDPVMGDNGTFYVADGIPAFFRDAALPRADIILPNTFEAAYLSGIAADTTDGAARAATILRQKGPSVAVVTGLRRGGSVGAIAAAADGCWLCMAPAIDIPAHGAGDAFAALFTGHFLSTRDLPGALGLAAAGIHAILSMTAEKKSDELCLIETLPQLDTLQPFPVDKIA